MDHIQRDEDDRLMMPGEAATVFRVSVRSLQRWSALGLLEAEQTPGGHRRYRESRVRALLSVRSTAPVAAEVA